jgi:hypothetical protein
MYNNQRSQAVLVARLRYRRPKNCQTGSEAQSASYSGCTVSFFRGVKRPEGEVNISKV